MPDVADLKVKIGITGTEDVSRGLAKANSEITTFASSAGKLGGAVGNVAADLAKVGLVAGGVVATGFAAVVRSASNFEHGMSAVQAATGASADEMAQLGAAAISLGGDVQLAGIDATDAATAMEELAKGGVSVTDQLGGATKGALLLASAGSIDVAEAAGIATKAMNIFGLAGTDVAHVADLLSAGANKSATDVSSLGQAFNQSASVAQAAGLSIEELTGTLAFLAQRGLEGSDAGTSLKTALQRLQAPTDVAAKTMADLGINVRDAQGHMLPMAQIADVLKDRLSGLSDAQRDAALQTIFGADAIRVGLALYQEGGAAITQWTAKVDDAGNAARTGATKNNNLAGSLDQLQATFQTAAIQIGGKFTPIVRTASDAIAQFVDHIANSPEAQKALDDLATKGAAALQRIIDKVRDPAFQTELRAWGVAALDLGKAIVGLAQDVGETLGPPLREAAGWFSGLDDQGRKNVLMFAAVAGSAVKFRDELGTLKTVVYDTIKAFAAKEAAKKSLELANKSLATSATGTGTAMTGAGAAATDAALAIGSGAVVVAAAAGVTIAGVAAISAYNDATGRTAQQFAAFNVTQEAAAFAIAHGATATNDAVAGFIRWIDMTGTAITSADTLAVAWNAYINNISLAGQNTQGFTLALTALQQAQLPVNKYLGEGLIAGQGFSDALAGLTVGAQAFAGTLPPLNTGLSGAATALGAVSHEAQNSALAMQDLNTWGTAAQQGMNALAGQALATELATQQLTATSTAYAQAAAIAEGDTGEFGTQLGITSGAITTFMNGLNAANEQLHGLGTTGNELRGMLGPLQAEWDALDAAVKKSGTTTAAQQAQYERLAPAIQYLNAQLGLNKNATVDATLEAIKNYQGVQNGNAAYQTQAATVASTAANLAGLAVSTAAAAAQTSTAAQRAAEYHERLREIPNKVTTTTDTPGSIQAIAQIAALNLAIAIVPKSFTVTAHVDTSQAIAAINDLGNMMPHSPAKEGPFKTLPNWAALFESWGPALADAIAAFEGFGNDVAKRGAETASSVAKGITDALGALTALGKLNLGKLPSGAQASGFLASLADFMERFTTATGAFEEDVLKAASAFADAAGKATGVIKNAVEGLTLIGTFKAPLASSVSAFLASLADFMEKFGTAAGGFEDDALKVANDFADAASKVGGSVGNALKGLQDLAAADWAKSSPTGSALSWFTHLTASLVANFATAATRFADDALANASAFADAAGKVGNAVGNALAGLKALAGADWANSSPSGSAMGWLTHLIASLTQNFADAARLFKDDALTSASAFADSAGKVVGVIGPAITALTAINTLVTPPKQAVDNLLVGIRYIVGQFGAMAATMETEGVAKLGAFSAAAGQALGAAKTGVDLFKDFDKLVIPSKQAIDNLVIAIHYVVDRFDEMARSLATEGIAKLQAFAAAAGQSLAAAKTGTDLFKDMEKLVVPSKEAIDNLLAGIRYVIDQMGATAVAIGTAGLARAQDFATGAKNVFDTVKAALDTVHSLKEYKDLPGDALRAIKLGMEDAITEMIGRAGQAAALAQNADTFLGSMQEAARKVAEGLRLGGVANVPEIGAVASNVGWRALGGPVLAGSAYIVGEQGPELFVPRVSGTIIPNGGGTTVQIVFNGPVYGGADFDARVQQAKVALQRRGAWD